MDAVEFLKVRKMMCKANNNMCYNCSLATSNGSCLFLAKDEGAESVVVHRVAQWAKYHPVKTRQSEFLKIFPNATLQDNVLEVNPCEIDSRVECEDIGAFGCFNCRRKYWLQEVE